VKRLRDFLRNVFSSYRALRRFEDITLMEDRIAIETIFLNARRFAADDKTDFTSTIHLLFALAEHDVKFANSLSLGCGRVVTVDYLKQQMTGLELGEGSPRLLPCFIQDLHSYGTLELQNVLDAYRTINATDPVPFSIHDLYDTLMETEDTLAAVLLDHVAGESVCTTRSHAVGAAEPIQKEDGGSTPVKPEEVSSFLARLGVKLAPAWDEFESVLSREPGSPISDAEVVDWYRRHLNMEIAAELQRRFRMVAERPERPGALVAVERQDGATQYAILVSDGSWRSLFSTYEQVTWRDETTVRYFVPN